MMINRFLLKRTSDITLLTIFIVLVLSMWGSRLITINGFYLPEIIILPLIVFLYIRRPNVYLILRRCVFSKPGIIAVSLLLFIAIVGLIRTESFVGPYSELRASVILVYAFIFFYRYTNQQSNLRDLLLGISFSVLCLNSLLVVLGVTIPGFIGPINDTISDEVGRGFSFGRATIPAINILVSAYLCSRTHRILLLLFVLFLGGIISLGGHRVILLITVISTLFVPLCMFSILFTKKLKNIWMKVFRLSFYLCLIGIFFPSGIIQDYLSISKGIQYRLITKTVDTYMGISSGLSGGSTVDFGDEGMRATYFAFLIEDLPWLLLPHGLGSREVYGKLGNKFDEIAPRFKVRGEYGNTHDMTILYMAYHHGLLMTGFIFTVVIFLIYRRLKSAVSGLDRAYVITALIGILFIDLATAPVPGINIALVYGGFLGLLLNWKSKRQSIVNTKIHVVTL